MRRKQEWPAKGCGCKICKQNQYYLKMGRFDIPEKINNNGWEGYSKTTFGGIPKNTIMRESLGTAWGEKKETVEELKKQRDLVSETDFKITIKHLERNNKK